MAEKKDKDIKATTPDQIERLERLIEGTQRLVQQDAQLQNEYAKELSPERANIRAANNLSLENRVKSLQELAEEKKSLLKASPPSPPRDSAPASKSFNGSSHLLASKKLLEVPERLQEGLRNIEKGGGVPMMVSGQLEAFLTAVELYQPSMTPEEAWEALSQYNIEHKQAMATLKRAVRAAKKKGTQD